jgi:DNA modification methylase
MSVRVLVGNNLETLRDLPERSVQTCVTSPPYYGLRSYLPDGHEDKPLEIGLEDTPDAYVARLVAVFREVRRVLRDDGTLFLNIGDSYANNGASRNGLGNSEIGSGPGGACKQRDIAGHSYRVPAGYKPKDLLMIPAQVALALRADGWWLRKDIIWHKPNPMPESVRDRPTSSHEHVFLLAKSAAYFYDAEAIAEEATAYEHGQRYGNTPSVGAAVIPNRNDSGPRMQGGIAPGRETRNARDVWTIATQPYSGAHFATMPPDLAERCIKAGSSERGQCPHCAAPWGRVIEVTERAGHKPRLDEAHFKCGSGSHPSSVREDRGWSPTCDCPPHQPVPQVVIDPFGGAGTTGLVADRLGRSAILCELNPEYARLARARLTADAPLLAVVA